MEQDKIIIDSIDDSAEWQSAHKSSHHPTNKKKQFIETNSKYKSKIMDSSAFYKRNIEKSEHKSKITDLNYSYLYKDSNFEENEQNDENDFIYQKPYKSRQQKQSTKTISKKAMKRQDKRLPFNKYSIIKILEDEQLSFETKIDMINDLITLTTLIKMQYGKITEWAQSIFHLDANQFKQLFNFRNGAHVISDKISKFKIPVYAPWIELVNELINHSDGAGMFRTYSNQFFNLNNTSITLSVLDKTWDIDLWLTVLTNIPSIQIYTIDTINTLAALYIELIRSYSITLHKDERKKLDIYKDIKIYINDICEYMKHENLLVMDYANYINWPNNVKIAMDAITEGEIKFYYGSNLFYKINMHNLTYDSAEEAIKYIIDIVYCANERKTIEHDGIFELENSEIINNKIIKLIYNILRMPKEVNIKLTTYKTFAGNEIILFHNKIHLLSSIFKYIIGFDRQYEKPLPKITRFCLLWNVIKQYSTKKICDSRTINDEELECISRKLNDIDYMYNVVESLQTNLLGLMQVIGYRLLTLLPNTTEVALNSRLITCIEEFVNTKIENIYQIELLFEMPPEFRIWLNYISGINVKDIPYKFNYTPIKLYRERCKEGVISYSYLPKALKLNIGFNNILSRLIDMKTPDIMGFPFDV